jgi:simple sugar transport system permease protein
MKDFWTTRTGSWLLGVMPLVVALVFVTLVLLLVGAPPGEALMALVDGAIGRNALNPFGRLERVALVLAAWVPLTLCAAGLLVTFTAGLWNIGVEGQVALGAIGATAVIRALGPDVPAPLMLAALLAGGAVGGALWGLLAGVIRVYGKVNEIFAGLGLNFVASGFTIFLVFGPWRQPRGGTMAGTLPFPENAWLPNLPGLEISPLALVLALVAVALMLAALGNTIWGLRLKAIGKNLPASVRLGIPAQRYMLVAFAVCGALAGVAGGVLASGFRHTLFPGVSSGYGYLGILVVLLAGLRAIWVAPIALFFAAVSIGSTQLVQLNLDSSLAGVLQDTLVLVVLLMAGLRLALTPKAAVPVAAEAAATPAPPREEEAHGP